MLSPRALLALGLVAFAAGWGTSSAQAAVCADYPNQAAAQRAHDTRDADGDGIYCEALPCPCLEPGGTGTSHRKPALGRPRLFATPTRLSGCRVRHSLPDARCTPGGYYPRADRARICRSGYSASVRNVSDSTKNQVYGAYGITRHSRATYEIDHLVPLEAGGSNQIGNLFPEAAGPRPGYHEKDRLENAVRARICGHGAGVRALQRRIARDWTALYRQLVG